MANFKKTSIGIARSNWTSKVPQNNIDKERIRRE
jgi:hypothetical protein